MSKPCVVWTVLRGVMSQGGGVGCLCVGVWMGRRMHADQVQRMTLGMNIGGGYKLRAQDKAWVVGSKDNVKHTYPCRTHSHVLCMVVSFSQYVPLDKIESIPIRQAVCRL